MIDLKSLNKMVKAGKLIKHHTSYTRGYVSRKIEGYSQPYRGRFGKGFIYYSPNWDSTQYSFITYYIYN